MEEIFSYLTVNKDPVKSIIEIFDVVMKALLAVIGYYLVHSINRNIALRVSEKRLDAFSSLWESTRNASPDHLGVGGGKYSH